MKRIIISALIVATSIAFAAQAKNTTIPKQAPEDSVATATANMPKNMFRDMPKIAYTTTEQSLALLSKTLNKGCGHLEKISQITHLLKNINR